MQQWHISGIANGLVKSIYVNDIRCISCLLIFYLFKNQSMVVQEMPHESMNHSTHPGKPTH